jgi:hypothetical protein
MRTSLRLAKRPTVVTMLHLHYSTTALIYTTPKMHATCMQDPGVQSRTLPSHHKKKEQTQAIESTGTLATTAATQSRLAAARARLQGCHQCPPCCLQFQSKALSLSHRDTGSDRCDSRNYCQQLWLVLAAGLQGCCKRPPCRLQCHSQALNFSHRRTGPGCVAGGQVCLQACQLLLQQGPQRGPLGGVALTHPVGQGRQTNMCWLLSSSDQLAAVWQQCGSSVTLTHPAREARQTHAAGA